VAWMSLTFVKKTAKIDILSLSWAFGWFFIFRQNFLIDISDVDLYQFYLHFFGMKTILNFTFLKKTQLLIWYLIIHIRG